MKRIVVIGGGIIGLSVAYKMGLRDPTASITVLEKENSVARHQSGHNSGVLHAGLYYRPGSLKARLAVAGIRAMKAFCREYGVPFEECGKLVVATDPGEAERLNDLLQRGRQNGLTGIQRLNRQEMLDLEPHVGGIASLHVPEEGIVDFVRVCQALVICIEQRGGHVRCCQSVRNVRRDRDRWRVITDAGEFEADWVVNCAGLYSDRIARLSGYEGATRIVPFRGEYFQLKEERRHLVRNLIYPVPDPNLPFLGVHCTRAIHGEVHVGPNAVLALSREGYTKWKVNNADVLEMLGFPGLRNFVRHHVRLCLDQMLQSCRKTRFCAAVQRLVPAISADDLEPGGAGVRAQAMDTTGELVQDFVFSRQPGLLHVINAPSPGATASLAIADHIIELASNA